MSKRKTEEKDLETIIKAVSEQVAPIQDITEEVLKEIREVSVKVQKKTW